MTTTASLRVAERPALSEGRGSGRFVDATFRWSAFGFAVFIVACLLAIVLQGVISSRGLLASQGVGATLSTTWDPASGHYGALPFVWGTVLTGFLAIAIAVPIAIGAALFLTEVASKRLRGLLAPFVDLLAAVPSVVFGFWGFVVLVPLIRPLQEWLSKALGWIPGVGALFESPGGPFGLSYFMGGVVGAVMVIPIVSALCRELFVQTPAGQREAALALGATRWESVKAAVLPNSRQGIVGAVILGLGRALGETIAILLVIGQSTQMHASIFAPGYTMSGVIANQFGESSGDQRSALFAIGFMLFAITLVVNLIARLILRRGASQRVSF